MGTGGAWVRDGAGCRGRWDSGLERGLGRGGRRGIGDRRVAWRNGRDGGGELGRIV